MKTIDEAATRWSGNSRLVGFTAFKAGVAFAQRWIPVEDELPNNFPIDIIAKNEEKYKAIYIENESCLNFLKNCYTHWRPIELK